MRRHALVRLNAPDRFDRRVGTPGVDAPQLRPMGYEAGGTTTVCVMGMHRSGTSVAARMLQLLGVSLGDPDLLLQPGRDNPAGYWENRLIKELNDKLLAHLSGSWDQPPVLDDGWEHDAALDDFRAQASVILADSFTRSRSDSDRTRVVVGWKDPRLSLLLPFWRTVTPIAATIVVVRDPSEVARSLFARNGIEAPQASLLWLRYLFAASSADPGHLVVRLDDFFTDLHGTLAAIAGHLGLPRLDEAVEHSAREHLEPTLRHHVTPDVDIGNPLVALAQEVWSSGALRCEVVPVIVADGIRRGWFRPPIDGEVLARARAQVVALRETVRRRRLTATRPPRGEP